MLTTPFHAANVIAHLERGGLTLDMFRTATGSDLKTDKAGNGDTYYEWQQVMDFYASQANVTSA
tara:strand:+ start:322 stop:513 length:192 start_codon:yes stop_codon:yes gene_type:complete